MCVFVGFACVLDVGVGLCALVLAPDCTVFLLCCASPPWFCLFCRVGRFLVAVLYMRWWVCGLPSGVGRVGGDLAGLGGVQSSSLMGLLYAKGCILFLSGFYSTLSSQVHEMFIVLVHADLK